jgi:hypothetical protein
LLLMQNKAIVSASFGGSVLEIFANQKTHIAHLDDPCFRENFELDPFLDFDERYSEIDVKSIGPEGCNTFFDVISALEHEAARLELNLLAAILERALDGQPFPFAASARRSAGTRDRGFADVPVI